MKHLATLSAFLLCLQFAATGQTTSVLFIGNSYTGVNNLPLLVENVAESAGDTISTGRHTPGGRRFLDHATDPTVHQLIRSQPWDFVVLQAQSQEPSFSLGQVQQEVFPYAEALCDTIRAANSCTTPLFYMTWGRENGDSRNCPVWPPVCTYEGMDSLLSLRYRTMADDNEAEVSPVGAVWRYIRTNHPTIGLYSNDGSHPSVEGSYAAACAFYTMILRKDPTNITYFFNIDKTTAIQIQAAAKLVVFDSLAKWNVGKFDPQADFFVQQNGRDFTFENSSQYGSIFFWDFGDGNTSSLPSPTHRYATDSSYTVQLIAERCGKSDTSNQVVVYSTVGINPLQDSQISLSPNPFSEGIWIKGLDEGEIAAVKVYSFDGKMMLELENPSLFIDCNTLGKGPYIVHIQLLSGKIYKSKILKP